MKVRYKPSAALEIEDEVSSVKELFELQAKVDEVLKVTACGDAKCRGTDLTHRVREVDGNKFFELRCNKCRKTLSFGQSKDQKTIYPRARYHKQHPAVKAGKAKEGDYIPNGGWEEFRREEEEA